MKGDRRALRQAAIEAAAYALLSERGSAGTSVLAVAKRAKASNETLYRWYGDKPGLFRALVARNAADVRARLTADLATDRPAASALAALGPALLALLVSERAIALNRAAAGDQTGALGAALTEAGRGTAAPLIGALLERARAEGLIAFDDTGDAVALYLDLLVGDLQIRRAIGALAAPEAKAVAARADRALDRIRRLLAPGDAPP